MSSADDFEKEIMKALEAVSQNTDEAVSEAAEEIAKEALESLKNNQSIPVRTGEYKKSFYLKRKKQKSEFKTVIANKKYRITHLLEYGHVTRNGTTRTKAFPHWRDAQLIADKLPQRIKEKMMNNGT